MIRGGVQLPLPFGTDAMTVMVKTGPSMPVLTRKAPVVKHQAGQHDQKSHGRWASGGESRSAAESRAAALSESSNLGERAAGAVVGLRLRRDREGLRSFGRGESDSAALPVREGQTREVGTRGVYEMTGEARSLFRDAGIDTPVVYELDPSAGGAELFHEAITRSKEGNPFASSVYVYPLSDYEGMRLFMSEDGQSGIALKNGDEIVSLFKTGTSGDAQVARPLMELAIQEGGRRGDCFDTVLPSIYADHGLKVEARVPWNDEYAPEGWDKRLYRKWNNGEPDVTFFRYDPAYFDAYEPGMGKRVDSYDAGTAAVRKSILVADSVAFLNRMVSGGDDEPASEEPVRRDGIAKGTVIRFAPGLIPVLKHLAGRHDQKTHGSWAGQVSVRSVSGGGGKGSGTKDDPIITDDVKVALAALDQELYVQLEQPEQISTLLDELAVQARDMVDGGKKRFNLCLVSVPGTNLFCEDNKGIVRDAMPQLSNQPLPGSRADSMPKDEKGRVDIAPGFLDHMAARGVSSSSGVKPASHLRATQSELDGADVARIAQGIRDNPTRPQAPTLITRDGYIIDGHHRWAARVALEYEGRDMSMPVTIIDDTILPVLQAANDYADYMGLPRKVMGAPTSPTVKSVSIRFTPGLRPVLKHLAGRHDQASHGAWAHAAISAGLSTKAPTKGRATANPIDGPDGTDWGSLPDDVKQAMRERVIDAFPTLGEGGVDPVDAIASNVLEALRHASPEIQAFGERWYGQAHNDAEQIARETGMTVEQAAGVLAALSPKTAWEPNVRWGHFMSDVVTRDPVIDRATLDSIVTKGVKDEAKPVSKTVKEWLSAGGVKVKPGTRLSELSLDDQVTVIQSLGQIDGAKIGLGPRLTPTGGLTDREYGNGPPLAGNMLKALKIMRAEPADQMSTITQELNGHKTRSFYNNILSGGMDRSVTIDVHALDASILGYDATVREGKAKNVFGVDPAVVLEKGGSYPDYGAKGTYALFREGFLQATDAINRDRARVNLPPLTPAQAQAIAWIVTLPAARQAAAA